jgi:hypothetical protein
MMRIRVDAYIKTILILTCGKLTEIYFLHLLSVNPRLVPSRFLLEDSPYRTVGDAVHRATSHDRTPRACGELGMSCGDLCKT